jgi:hypothetical protein
MQVQTRVHAREPSVLDNVAQRLERSLVVVALGDRLPFRVRVLLVRHQDRHLGAQLGQLEGACKCNLGLANLRGNKQPAIPLERPPRTYMR